MIGGKWARVVMKEFPDDNFDPKLVKKGPEKVDTNDPGKLEPDGNKKFPPDSFPDNKQEIDRKKLKE